MLVNIIRNMLQCTHSETQGPGKHEHSYIYIYIYVIYTNGMHAQAHTTRDPGEEEEEGAGRSTERSEEGGGRMDDKREERGWRREQ